MIMKPFSERIPDNQYKRLLQEILDNGERVQSQQGEDAITYVAPAHMRFNLDNGFPMITERNMNPKISDTLPETIWKQAVGEIFCFINGGRTLAQLADHGNYVWTKFLTPEKCAKRGLEAGDNGPGSYGAAFHDFPMLDGRTFNQFKHIVEQIKEEPQLRTHFITPWIPQYVGRGKGKKQEVVVAPCHGWVNIIILNGKMTLHMFQRSGDVPVGVPSNMVQYAALTFALAQVTGTIPHQYVHTISNAHIYVNQLDAVKTMLARESRPFPTLTWDTSIHDIFSFRKDHFHLGDDYQPHPGIKGIPVAI